MGKWREVLLGDIADIQTGPFGSQLHASDYVLNGTPCVMPKNIGANLKLDISGIAKIKFEDWQRLSKYHLKIGDIIYSRRGDVEKCAYITKNEEGWLCGTGCLIVRIKQKEVNSKFLSYLLSTPDLKSYIASQAVGTIMPNLNTGILQKVPISFPAYSEQVKIASVLSSLDDKIALLQRQNETLEQLAETIFRQWFVEEAQDDWLEYQVQDIARHVKEGVNPMEFPTEEFNHYSLPAFDNGRTPAVELGSSILSNKFRMAPNSVLVSKLNPRVPRIWLISNNLRKNSVCSTEFQVILPDDAVNAFFLFCLFMSDDAISELAMAASGTSGSHQRVRPEDILKLKFKTPSLKRITEFSTAAQPLFEKIIVNIDKAVSLSNLRDTLLPKLMSGEVRVKH